VQPPGSFVRPDGTRFIWRSKREPLAPSDIPNGSRAAGRSRLDCRSTRVERYIPSGRGRPELSAGVGDGVVCGRAALSRPQRDISGLVKVDL
jgi:hypothetical protein